MSIVIDNAAGTISGLTAPLAVGAAVAAGDAVPLAQCPITKEYLSTGQTITQAGLLTLPHGLGTSPKIISAYIKCTTANGNFAIGDELETSMTQESSSAADSFGVSIWKDSTNIYVRYGNSTQVFVALDKTGGNGTNLTNASWQLYIKAWA